MDLKALNPQQRIAAETLDGPLLILAGAGSGKTRALTYRVANLIEHGVPAWNILALTFTNKAAKEMKRRVEELIGAEKADEAWISTFHSVCARMLRRDIEKIGYSRSFVIYDEDDQARVLKDIYRQLNIDEQFIHPREVRARISDAKNRMLTPDEWFEKTGRDYRNGFIHDIMVAYEKRMKSMNALDFDDLLIKTLELMADHPPVLDAYRRRFRYVLVDEYQDTNHAQYELVRLITTESRNICVVGDDDQSIYGWRGADIRNILDFEKDYPDAKVIKLEQNYRSTSNILDAANQVIANNEERKDKKLWTEHGEGEKIRVYCASDEHDEAAWIAGKIIELKNAGYSYGNNAVLYRTNAQSRVLEEMLIRTGIPYKVFGGQKFYDRKEIRDILAYLRVVVNPADDISLGRIINVPKRAIGDTTVQILTEHAARNEMPLFSALSDLPETLGTRARSSVTAFASLMTRLCAMKDTMDLESFVDYLISEAGLEEQYIRENDDESRARLENIGEFRGTVREYAESEDNPTIDGYLENVSLITDLDREADDGGYVTLMTLHSAKGLEFTHVFIPGLEEGIFPGYRSITEEDRLEEERRLMYVGITRAKSRLFLTYAEKRMLYNQFQHNAQSRFLQEVPARLKCEESSRERRFMRDHGQKPDDDHAWNGSGYHAAYGNQSTAQKHPAEGRVGVSVFPGRPKLKLNGVSLDRIPGVKKGFVESEARTTDAPLQMLFRKGDRVRHPKFGDGVVYAVSGAGASARITIEFEKSGVRELSLAVAPIVKTEGEE